MAALSESFSAIDTSHILTVLILLSLSAFAVRALHIFTFRNGTFERFFHFLKEKQTPSGNSFTSLSTNGFVAFADKQIAAFAFFMLCFTEDLSRPGTTMCGFLFAGSWAPAWVLLTMESFRAVNTGHWLSYLALPGYVIFHYSHALGTPLYLALALNFLPSCSLTAQTPDQLYIGHDHLVAMPVSFVLGYIFPVVLMCLPSPTLVSKRFKDTANGLYQQWHIIIVVIHYAIVWTQRLVYSESSPTTPIDAHVEAARTLQLLDTIYITAFMLAAIPYQVVSVISWTAYLAPSLFNADIVDSLKPRNVLVPQWPRHGLKVKTVHEGFKWLIQWDHLLGTTGIFVWAVFLRSYAATLHGGVHRSVPYMMGRALFYFFVGGPVGVGIGFMRERDHIVFGTP